MEISLEGVRDEPMRERLLTKENYQLLEHLLHLNYLKLDYLEAENKEEKLDYGKKIKKKDLEIILEGSLEDIENFLQIKIEKPRIKKSGLFSKNMDSIMALGLYAGAAVMSFGGIDTLFSGISVCSLIGGGYFLGNSLISLLGARMLHRELNRACYKVGSNTIHEPLPMLRNREMIVKNDLYHELSHVALHQKYPQLRLENQLRIFNEGFATSVDINVMNKVPKKEATYFAMWRKSLFLKEAYKEMSLELRLPKSNALAKRKYSEKLSGDDLIFYTYGTALFTIAEHKHPEENIYQKILRGDLFVL